MAPVPGEAAAAEGGAAPDGDGGARAYQLTMHFLRHIPNFIYFLFYMNTRNSAPAVGWDPLGPLLGAL